MDHFIFRGIESERKIKPPRPPVPRPTSWCSQKIPEDFSEPNIFLFDKLPNNFGISERKTFLRPAEHILATFYGLVFEIQGKVWNVLNSEHLPIYFVRVSVKNIKYPFRILVIDHGLHRVSTEKYILYIIHYTLYIIHYTLHIIHYTLYIIHIHYTLYIIYYILYIIHIVLCY